MTVELEPAAAEAARPSRPIRVAELAGRLVVTGVGRMVGMDTALPSPSADRPAPTPGRWINTQDLRYLLTVHLFRVGPQTIAQLVRVADGVGWAARGRPSKVVSDLLRTEINRGRVRRVGRGVYGPGSMPRSTGHRIRQRVAALPADTADAADTADTADTEW